MKSTDNKKSPHIYSAFVVYTHITLIVCVWFSFLSLFWNHSISTATRSYEELENKYVLWSHFLPVFLVVLHSFIRTPTAQKRANSTLDSNICFDFDMWLLHCYNSS